DNKPDNKLDNKPDNKPDNKKEIETKSKNDKASHNLYEKSQLLRTGEYSTKKVNLIALLISVILVMLFFIKRKK
ncbi:hypothetical protein, partial [Lactococcus lactis]|uniref:hypothetical protein n=1 Tax=Lactococcus lactis TaxID=1358 RepID=UPI0024A9A8AF